MSVIFISHDLALVSEIADRIVVMYKGTIVLKVALRTLSLKRLKKTIQKRSLAHGQRLNSRLKQLPTVSDFLSNTISKQVPFQRPIEPKSTKKFIASRLYWKSSTLRKTYFSKASFFWNKNLAI